MINIGGIEIFLVTLVGFALTLIPLAGLVFVILIYMQVKRIADLLEKKT